MNLANNSRNCQQILVNFLGVGCLTTVFLLIWFTIWIQEFFNGIFNIIINIIKRMLLKCR